MNWLWKLLLPKSLGISGGGDGGSGTAAADEESRKAKLRRQIDRLYGMYSPEPSMDPNAFPKLLRGIGAPVAQQANAQIAAQNATGADEASTAAKQLGDEKTKLADATRSYYTDQLGKDYKTAERNTRFRLARQGLLGGSADADLQGDVAADRDLGATRVDEAVRRAMAQLTGQREDERLNAINLVNAGAGDDAVRSAQAGIENSFQNVSSQQKADLFGDLFTNASDAGTASNLNAAQAALAARYRERLGSFFPQTSTTSGRVTPSGG